MNDIKYGNLLGRWSEKMYSSYVCVAFFNVWFFSSISSLFTHEYTKLFEKDDGRVGENKEGKNFEHVPVRNLKINDSKIIITSWNNK